MYLDSSALLKLLVEEAESAALAAFVAGEAGMRAVSSELAVVEVVRAVRRVAPAAVADARSLVAQLDLVPLSGDVVAQATEVGGPLLRTLDALHLASPAFALALTATAGAALAQGRPMHVEGASLAALGLFQETERDAAPSASGSITAPVSGSVTRQGWGCPALSPPWP